jgi:ketosteroid isomerase-like protein
MDNGNATSRKLGVEYMRNSRLLVIEIFKHENYAMKVNSHLVSADGRFIALSGTYTETGKDGNPASVPIAVILEVKDGKLIREDVYYDSSPYY